MRIGNALLKGLKVAGQTLAGVVGFGLTAAATGWVPTPTGTPVVDTLLPFLWISFGSSIVAGGGAALTRWATYKPTLDPQTPRP